jgi:hypothetical protein
MELSAYRAFHVISSIASNNIVLLVILVEAELEMKVILTLESSEIPVVKLRCVNFVLYLKYALTWDRTITTGPGFGIVTLNFVSR